MSPPYRPEPTRPPIDPELERLIAGGQQARHDAATQVERDRAHAIQEGHADTERQLRLCIGAVRGSLRRRLVVALAVMPMVTTPLLGLVMDVGPKSSGYVIMGLVYGLFVLLVAAIMQPLASRAKVRAERQRVGRLPYRLEGLFETLGTKAHTVRFELHFEPSIPPPDGTLVHAAFCAVDPAARFGSLRGHCLVLYSGAIEPHDRGFASGSKHDMRRQYDDRGVGLRTLALVDRVLPPVHASFGLIRVLLAEGSRDDLSAAQLLPVPY